MKEENIKIYILEVGMPVTGLVSTSIHIGQNFYKISNQPPFWELLQFTAGGKCK